MASPIVELAGVRRSFGHVIGLDDFSLEVPAGAVTVLVGPNGAGKTTAIRVITGSLRTEAGTVRVFGLDPLANGAAVRSRIGVVAAQPALYDRLTGRANLQYAADLFGAGKDAPIEAAAARFGIDDALDLKVGGYSTGMKTRLALARSVLHDPDLLLLDEPTSGLDPESARAVLGLIDEFAEAGRTVIMSTHLLLEAEGLADTVVLMTGGRATLSGTPASLSRALWPAPAVVLDAEDRTHLDALPSLPGVLSFDRNGGPARITLDDLARVPDLVAHLCAHGARLTQVTPHEPTLEELYFAARQIPLP
jgi:ABC-type multidrug transport system ATPase subunit